MWRFSSDYYSGPRPPANGIVSKTGRGQRFGQTWWGNRWADVLDELVDPNRLQRGRSYARGRRVLSLDVKPGIIEASVIGSRPEPYEIEVRLKPFSDETWEQVFDEMSGQARFAAKLLAGEMPHNIEEAFDAADVTLFPQAESDLETYCSCPDWANPCKHVAAVYLLLGEEFDDDPFVIFRLRGRDRKATMTALRERRALGPAVVREAVVAPIAPEHDEVPPLEQQLERFWSSAGDPNGGALPLEAPANAAEAIKWLGTPGFWESDREFVPLMERLYASITRAALKAAYGDS
jgi:uncharacterized Zn finger protein